MSFSTLGIGASGLTAARRSVETAAHNVANSGVEGYTRQRVALAAQPATPMTAGMRGNGVQVVAAERLRSTVGDLTVRSEADAAGSAQARAAVLDRAQGVLGPYAGGVPESLTELWDAFSGLSTSPKEAAARSTVLTAADQVATGLRDAALELDQVRSSTTAQLTEEVAEVNSLTRSVADLNDSIADVLLTGQAPNDLLDARDVALDRLAGLTGAVATARPDGRVEVTIGGQAVVTRSGATEVVLGSSPPPAGSSGDDPVLRLGTDPGAPPLTAGGSVGGRVSALTVDLRDVEVRLDDVARAVRTTVNEQHARGYDLAGEPGGAVFSGDTAREMAVDPALREEDVAAAGAPDGGEHDGAAAAEMARLRRPAEGTSLADQLVGLATLLGSRAAAATRTADAADASLAGAQEQREAHNGVSVDEEMIDLVRFQHAYDAAARVISIADGMLDTLINRTGAGR